MEKLLTNVEIPTNWEKSSVNQGRLPVSTKKEVMFGVIILRRNAGETNPSFFGSQKIFWASPRADPCIVEMKIF